MKITAKILLVLLIIASIFSYFHFNIGEYLSLSSLKSSKQDLIALYNDHTVWALCVYFLIYVASTALSLPGATILTLAAGAVFGFSTGLVVVSFASTIGASCAFLVSRYLLQDSLQNKYKQQLQKINEGIEQEGGFYLFTMRLIPIFPFFLINILMGLSTMKLFTFYWVSQLGMLAGTAVYVNAGSQLANIDSLKDIASPQLIFSFALLGIFPLFAKKLISSLKVKKVYKAYKKPKSFDYNLIAIGAGAGGLVSCYIGAAVKAKTALIEKHKMGGDCLNTGCVPSKALIRTAKMLNYANNSAKFGIASQNISLNFSDVMERVQNIISKIEPHDSVERYTNLGVDCIMGEAKIVSPWEVSVNGKTLTTKNIVVATGGRPFVPEFEGLEDVREDVLVSDNLWEIRELPKNFVVLGAGPIGCEMAQSFSRLGSQVKLVDMAPQIMMKEDLDASEFVLNKFKTEGIELYLNHAIKSFKKENGKNYVLLENNGELISIEFDKCLCALGRKANVTGFGLEELNIELNNNGTIKTNSYLQTNYPNIYAVGDVAGPYQFTHTASHMAWYASVNSLFRPIFKVDYSVIPWATFTDPEVARCGISEQEAKDKGLEVDIYKYDIDDLDRAIADSSDYGFVKVILQKSSDKILGVCIVGPHAGDLIAEFVLAMKHGLGLNKILSTIHLYPSLAEANKYVAGVWKNQSKPEKLLDYLAKFHNWRRS